MQVAELFAGAGGFGLGFRQGGAEVLWALENEPNAVATYARNFPGTPLLSDAAQRVDWTAIARQHGQPDLVLASPPCEPFTPAKAARRTDPMSRLYHDPTGGLVLHTILALKAIKPRAFLIENVVQLAEGPLRRELADLLRRAGYEPHFHILRAEDHGSASRRARLFICSHPLEPEAAPPRTVREAIGDLEDLDAPVENHRPDEVPRALRGKLATLDAGRSLRFWRGATGRVYGTWTRVAYDEVAPTVKGSGRFVHPSLDRALSPREHARLMGFPDAHVFEGSLNRQYDQVGEAVAVPMARALADSLLVEVKERAGPPR